MPTEVIDDAWNTIKSYFDQDLAVKSALQITDDEQFGYLGFGDESLSYGLEYNASGMFQLE